MGAKDWTVSVTPSLLPAGPQESSHFLLPPPFPVPTRGGTEARPTSAGYGLCAWTCQHSAAWAREKVLQHPQNMPRGFSIELLWLWKCPFPGVQSTAYILLVQLRHDSCMGSRETSLGAEGFPGEDPPPGGLRGGLRQAPERVDLRE